MKYRIPWIIREIETCVMHTLSSIRAIVICLIFRISDNHLAWFGIELFRSPEYCLKPNPCEWVFDRKFTLFDTFYLSFMPRRLSAKTETFAKWFLKLSAFFFNRSVSCIFKWKRRLLKTSYEICATYMHIRFHLHIWAMQYEPQTKAYQNTSWEQNKNANEIEDMIFHMFDTKTDTFENALMRLGPGVVKGSLRSYAK